MQTLKKYQIHHLLGVWLAYLDQLAPEAHPIEVYLSHEVFVHDFLQSYCHYSLENHWKTSTSTNHIQSRNHVKDLKVLHTKIYFIWFGNSTAHCVRKQFYTWTKYFCLNSKRWYHFLYFNFTWLWFAVIFPENQILLKAKKQMGQRQLTMARESNNCMMIKSQTISYRYRNICEREWNIYNAQKPRVLIIYYNLEVFTYKLWPRLCQRKEKNFSVADLSIY